MEKLNQQKEFPIETECFRNKYEFEIKQRMYCPKDKCMYKDVVKDYTNNYRCMRLDKQI